MRVVFASALALVSGCALAPASESTGESASALAEGPTYAQTIDAVVNPYCRVHGDFGAFAGVGGVSIAYAKWEVPNERGAIVLLPGRT